MKSYRVLVFASLGLSSCNATPPPSPVPDAPLTAPTRATPTSQSPTGQNFARSSTPRVSALQTPQTRLTPAALPSPASYRTDTQASGNLPLRLPAPPTQLLRNDVRIAPLQAKIQRAQIFAAYQQLAQIYLSLGRYDNAAKTLRAEAAQYRRKGFKDAAIIRERQASRYETQFQLFADRFPNAGEQRVLDTRARLEPTNGAYLGAFIDRDDALPDYFLDENFQRHARANDWAQLVGKPHSSHSMYLRYGNKFPRAWIEHLKKQGAIPHIAWEPIHLKYVQDDKYLRDFARAARKANWPIFFRFASEMNGDWTPYYGAPKLYREKFRLVNRVLHEEAPLAATIWCVNNPPLGDIQKYYPGDDGCDWVGVNFYAPVYYDNNRNRPARDDNPLSLLDPIYKTFAARKPIAICEFATSHRSIIDDRSETTFSQEKLTILYDALPRLYPRVKMVNWFSMNTIRHATPGKTKSDYSLGGDAQVRSAYARAIAPAYYRSTYSSTRDVVPMPRVLQQNQNVSGVVPVSVWAKTYVACPKVYLEANGKIIYASDALGVQRIPLDTRQFATGKLTLKSYLYDNRNRFIRSQSVVLNVSQN